MKCNKQLKYSNYVAFSHFHGTAVNNSGLVNDFDYGIEIHSESQEAISKLLEYFEMV